MSEQPQVGYEMTGKLETTYVWSCSSCGTPNRVTDDRHCVYCNKEASDERVFRHFKLTPNPIRLGFVT